MNSTSLATSLVAREIVKTDDPKVIELAQHMLEMDSDSLLTLTGEVYLFLDSERSQFEQRMAWDVTTLRVARAVILKRILDSGGRAIPHNEYRCEIEATKSIEKRIDVLRRLEGKVPEPELRKALYLTNPKPEWKADATQLKTLARKYGGEIAAIVGEALVESFGPPRLVFEPREQTANVTPLHAEVAS